MAWCQHACSTARWLWTGTLINLQTSPAKWSLILRFLGGGTLTSCSLSGCRQCSE